MEYLRSFCEHSWLSWGSITWQVLIAMLIFSWSFPFKEIWILLFYSVPGSHQDLELNNIFNNWERENLGAGSWERWESSERELWEGWTLAERRKMVLLFGRKGWRIRAQSLCVWLLQPAVPGRGETEVSALWIGEMNWRRPSGDQWMSSLVMGAGGITYVINGTPRFFHQKHLSCSASQEL